MLESCCSYMYNCTQVAVFEMKHSQKITKHNLVAIVYITEMLT